MIWFQDAPLRWSKIAKREKVGKRYVSRVIRLAFLAPEIVEQIVNGCQPPELTAQSLLNDRTELPLAWEAQHKVLGFPFPAWSFRAPFPDRIRRSVEAVGRRAPIVRPAADKLVLRTPKYTAEIRNGENQRERRRNLKSGDISGGLWTQQTPHTRGFGGG
jgi:hypothetical protein